MCKEIYKEMESAIDAAWDSEDPKTKALQQLLFPEGKPAVEVFILRIAEYIKSRNQKKPYNELRALVREMFDASYINYI